MLAMLGQKIFISGFDPEADHPAAGGLHLFKQRSIDMLRSDSTVKGHLQG